MEKERELKESVIDNLLREVLKFEKRIMNDKKLLSHSNLNELKSIIEKEVSSDAD